MVNIETVKKLRDDTGHSITKCKEALEESAGDIEKAYGILREKGALTAQKKAGRDLNAGVIQAYIHTTNQIGAMVELLCETDFVGRNEDYITLARDIAMHCAAFQPQYVSREQISEDDIKQSIAELEEGVDKKKSKEMQTKIVQGMLDAKLKSVVLLEQGFVKDETRTIRQLLDEATQKFGERIEIGRTAIWLL